MSSPHLEQALRFKNNAVRGALIEDIFIRNIQISELYTGTSASRGMALSIDFYYEEGPEGNRTPIVRNIDIRNVTANKANYALFLRGFPDDHIEDVRLYDCHFNEVQRTTVIEYVDRLAFFNVTLNGEELTVPVPTPTPTVTEPSPTPTDPSPTPTEPSPTPTEPSPTPSQTEPSPTPSQTEPSPTQTPTQATEAPTEPTPSPSSSSLMTSTIQTVALIMTILIVVNQ